LYVLSLSDAFTKGFHPRTNINKITPKEKISADTPL